MPCFAVFTIAKTERGAMTPRIGTLHIIAGALGVGMADLFPASPAMCAAGCTEKKPDRLEAR
jgi:transcriptional regulator with XRE-family HTH domain